MEGVFGSETDGKRLTGVLEVSRSTDLCDVDQLATLWKLFSQIIALKALADNIGEDQ